MGPRARDILAAVTEDDCPTPRSRSSALRSISVAGARSSRCASPTSASSAGSCTCRSRAATVYDALTAAGRAARPRRRRLPRDRVAAAGEGLPRLGRRHRARPFAAEAGLGFAVKLGSTSRSSAARRSRRRPRRSSRGCSPLHHRGPARSCCRPRDDLPRRPARRLAVERRLRPQARPRSATATCATRGGVDAETVLAGRYELEVATERHPAAVFLRPLYDPEMIPHPRLRRRPWSSTRKTRLGHRIERHGVRQRAAPRPRRRRGASTAAHRQRLNAAAAEAAGDLAVSVHRCDVRRRDGPARAPRRQRRGRLRHPGQRRRGSRPTAPSRTTDPAPHRDRVMAVRTSPAASSPATSSIPA